jgi:hypothetical protein
MTRKDTADLDRPHYYSQFWVDIAAGKRDVTATPATEIDLVDLGADELAEDEFVPPPAPVVKPAAKAKPAKPAERAPEPARPTITSLADLANIDLLMKSSAEMDNDTVPDIESSEIGDLAPFGQPVQDEEPAIVTDFDLDHVSEEPAAAEDEDEFADVDFDEEEEDEWGAPRRGGGKPQKPPRKREPRERRGF